MDDEEGLGEEWDDEDLGDMEDNGGSANEEVFTDRSSFRLNWLLSRELFASLLLWFSVRFSAAFACILRTLLTEEGRVEDDEVIS